MMGKNLFIALEGIDGSGKSTQAKMLAERLQNNGHSVYLTFEPTGNYIGSIIRNILKGKQKADEHTIAGLFLADRLDHLLNEDYGLVRKMREGFTVITDRYYFSSYAYHGAHVDMRWVIAANEMCARILKPHIHFFIDVPPEACMQRIGAGRTGTELYETLDNLKAVHSKYLEAFDLLRGTEHVIPIDGTKTPGEVAAGILQCVNACFEST